MTDSTTPPQTPHTPTVLVVGTGAVGGFYAARLAAAGAQVSVVCRSDYATIAQQGITIHSFKFGEQHFHPYSVHEQPETFPGTPDYMLITLKVLPQIDLAAMVAPKIGPNTTLLLIQNGIEIEEKLHQAFPNTPMISALAFVCVSRTQPGHIDHLCFGHLSMGHYPPQPVQPALTQLVQLFKHAQIDAHATDNVVTARWRKLVWNAPFNGVSVLAGGLNTREIMDDAPLQQLCRDVMAEVVDLAAAAGHALADDVIEVNMQATERMQPYRTSMLLDHEAGREMEVEAIFGNALQRAQQLGRSYPHLQSFYALLRAIGRKR
ncbi:ketopantoate reductase [Magnetococcus marinus MC-1]|uniref:2-dehydropantoate 2-reductase n=1 Tax=Magnetococcus marinus (strain ATCC BAA-1437 / JCM 17883 / MC-1) TaxID=156889 RepID=A0L534_MAGMM|nr:2-dehydropantoate 2-reductase [Magnetococcus marinus]ABK43077.1 ketopantoate reductase [Magnetococcus marinus MC-1]